MNEESVVAQSQKIILTKRTVAWLVANTQVDTFDPLHMSGYQRDVDDAHRDRIVEALKNEFFLPTAIICSSRGDYSLDTKLYVVDGQHRIAALKKMKVDYPARFSEIADFELPLIVMIKPTMEKEIDTFITINKTSKKVDTSLAYILRGIINQGKTSSDVTMPRRDYLSVQTAWNLTRDDAEENLWKGKILFEGATRTRPETITLNAFVLSTRKLIACIEKTLPIAFKWDKKEQIEDHISFLKFFILRVWEAVSEKWPDLFDKNDLKLSVIQGAIGYSSINRFVCLLLDKWKKNSITNSVYDTIQRICDAIRDLPADSSVWKTNSYYAKYSSEAGYAFVANDLYQTLPAEYSSFTPVKSDQDLLIESLRDLSNNENLISEVRQMFDSDEQLRLINQSVNNSLFLYRLSSIYSDLFESFFNLDFEELRDETGSALTGIPLPKIELLLSSKNSEFDFRYLNNPGETEKPLNIKYCKALSLIFTWLLKNYCSKKQVIEGGSKIKALPSSLAIIVSSQEQGEARVSLSF